MFLSITIGQGIHCLILSRNKLLLSCFYLSALQNLPKTLWEKEKLLVTSNFSFSHSVFYPFGELFAIFISFKIVICKLQSVEESKICLRIHCLILSRNKLLFLPVCIKKIFRKHSGKRRNCSLRVISPFPTVFSTLLENCWPFS